MTRWVIKISWHIYDSGRNFVGKLGHKFVYNKTYAPGHTYVMMVWPPAKLNIVEQELAKFRLVRFIVVGKNCPHLRAP